MKVYRGTAQDESWEVRKCVCVRLCLHESYNPGSTHFRSRTEFQSTNGCGLSQSGLQSRLGVFTLEANPG